jgi:hypothetical protein
MLRPVADEHLPWTPQTPWHASVIGARGPCASLPFECKAFERLFDDDFVLGGLQNQQGHVMAWVRVHNSTQNYLTGSRPQVPTSISNNSNASSRVIFMLASNARYEAPFTA